MRQILLTILALAMTFAVPAIAGGPVIVTEEAPIADTRPQGDGGNWVVPVIVGLVVIGALIGNGGDDCTCNSGGTGCGC